VPCARQPYRLAQCPSVFAAPRGRARGAIGRCPPERQAPGQRPRKPCLQDRPAGLRCAVPPGARREHDRDRAAQADGTLKRISEALDTAGRPIEAALYAREALGTGPTAKWTAYTAWLTLRATVKSRDQAHLRRSAKPPKDESVSLWRRWYFGRVSGHVDLPSSPIRDHPPSERA
jgi:hypothetical protein